MGICTGRTCSPRGGHAGAPLERPAPHSYTGRGTEGRGPVCVGGYLQQTLYLTFYFKVYFKNSIIYNIK
jgi:hypothetical protein